MNRKKKIFISNHNEQPCYLSINMSSNSQHDNCIIVLWLNISRSISSNKKLNEHYIYALPYDKTSSCMK